MKKAFLILGIAVAALAISCTREEVMKIDETKTFNGDKAYFIVNISEVGTSSTRATSTGFEYGSAAEYAIHDANFYFYASDGSFVAEAKVENPGGSKHAADDYDGSAVQDAVEFDANTVITLQGLTDKSYPNWVVTVLNEPENFKAPNTLDEFEGLLANEDDIFSVEYNDVTYYTMSSSSYYSTANGYPDTPTCWFATPVVDSNFSLEDVTYDETNGYYVDADGSQIDPVDIYVERLAAKVYLSTSLSGNSDGYYEIENELSDANGVATETKFYVKFDGWLLNATAKNSNLTKTIKSTTDWTSTYFYPTGTNANSTYSFDWNDVNNHRSYWGESFNYGLGKASDYPDSSSGSTDATETTTPLNDYLLYTSLYATGISLNTINSTSQYCAENTNTAGQQGSGAIITDKMSSAITSILVAATLYEYDEDTQTYSAIEDMIRCDGVLYTVADYKNYALSHLAGYYVHGTVTTENQDNYPGYEIGDDIYTELTVDDVTIADKYDGYVHVVLASKYTDSTDENYVGADFVFYSSDGTTTYTVSTVSGALDSFNSNYGSDANYYNGGRMYYDIPIEHLNDDYEETYTYTDGQTYTWVLEGNYGIVRNHIYYVDITAVENIGHGIYNPDEVIVPQPETPTYALAADIHILSWKIVNQSVAL